LYSGESRLSGKPRNGRPDRGTRRPWTAIAPEKTTGRPALPGGPTGTWQQVIWALLEAGAQETGALINVVTPDLDRGPVVAFDRFPIVGDGFDPLWQAFRQKAAAGGVAAVAAAEGETEPLFAAVRRCGEQREIPLLYQTVKAFVTGRLSTDGCSIRGDGLTLPLDLTAEVTAELEARG